MHHTTLYAIRQKHHLPSEQYIVWDGEIAGVVETVNVVVTLSLPLLFTGVGLLGWFSKIVKICYDLYVAQKENYEETPIFCQRLMVLRPT
jgi:hypothetical protein